MPDSNNKFDIQNFQFKQNYVIEASAGTGKTYSITHIVEKLVKAQGYNHVDLGKILIVTYTEKAAGELRSRVRDLLPDEDVDNAPIFTIHSFCQNSIKEFCLSTNKPTNLDLVDDNALEDFANRYIREGDILNEISFYASLGLDFAPENIAPVLVDATRKYYLDSCFNEDESIIKFISDEDVDSLFDDVMHCSSFDELLIKNENVRNNYNVLINSGDGKTQLFANAIKESYVSLFKYDGSSFKTSAKWPANEDERNAFSFFHNAKESLSKIKIDYLIAGKFLKDFYIAWQLEKEKNKKQSFDDMIRTVREAVLNEMPLLYRLREKYQYAIIDEFQDTNQKQFDIFKGVFMCDGHNLIVVGDPKQSIYSFQGADVQVYKKAVNDIVENGGIRCFLPKNHRSTPSIVNSCNKLFERYGFDNFVGSEWLSNNADGREHRMTFDGEVTPAIWIPNCEIKPEDFASIAVKQIIDCCFKDTNGNTRLRVASQNKEFRNVSFKDFVVLARTSSEMGNIEKALKRAGIPYVRYKDNKLFIGKECAHWIALLQAINVEDFTGKNRQLFKKALFTDFFGLSLKEINNEKYNRDDIEEVALLNSWKNLSLERKWEDLFDDIIISSGIVDRLSSLSKLQTLSVFKQIANYCIDYLSNNHSLEDLILNLSNLSAGGVSEEDDEGGSIIEKSTNFDCVQIMTIHASKGLQFPVVISVAGFKAKYPYILSSAYHDKDNDDKSILKLGTNKDSDNELYEEWKRLWYVAYTRPQFLLILPNYDKGVKGLEAVNKAQKEFADNNPDLFKPLSIDLPNFAKLRAATSAILSSNENDNTNSEIELEEQNKLLKNMIKEKGSKSSYKHSYSSLSHPANEENNDVFDGEIEINKEGTESEGLAKFDLKGMQILGDYDTNQEPMELPRDYPKGTGLGNAIHEVFERSNFVNYQPALECIIRDCYQKQGFTMKDEWMMSTKEMVDRVLHASLPIVHGNKKEDGNFKLCEIPNRDKKAELEFNFNFFDERLKNYCNGFIDLTFRRGDYYSILDWKSDRLNDDFLSYSDPVELKKHVDDSYAIQRVLYSYCLIKWLKIYYPSLSEEEIFNQHFGGVYYVFVRGCNPDTCNGVYIQTWNSWQELEDAFNNIANQKGRK